MSPLHPFVQLLELTSQFALHTSSAIAKGLKPIETIDPSRMAKILFNDLFINAPSLLQVNLKFRLDLKFLLFAGMQGKNENRYIKLVKLHKGVLLCAPDAVFPFIFIANASLSPYKANYGLFFCKDKWVNTRASCLGSLDSE